VWPNNTAGIDGTLWQVRMCKRRIEFSPGFVAPARHSGSPRIFVSHGTRDGVLPIGRFSRRIVPELKRGGYDVLYRKFDGGHTILPEIASEAVGWFTRRRLS
jgi:phospholipase/carboxylesterase